MTEKPPKPNATANPVVSADAPDTKPAESVQFGPLSEHLPAGLPQSIDLLLDVPLQVSAQLGRTRVTVREILQLRPGSLLELDKLAGEPVDIMVNGSLVARGEVVVVDEHFGVRVTEVVDRNRRLRSVQ